MSNPLFTIITVTYNAASVIAPTLKSVLAQTFTDYEFVVADGASTDNTVALVEAAHIANTHIVSEPDKGLYDAMNKAIARAKGSYLIFLNAGDAFASSNVLRRLAVAAESDADILYGQTQLVNADREVVGMRHLTAPAELDVDSFRNGMVVCHQAFVAKRSIVENYNLNYRFSADYEWCIRCLQKSKANAYVGDTPIISFLTDGLTDKHHKASLRERYKIMSDYFGSIDTFFMHIKFLPRYLREKVRKSMRKK